MLISNKFLWDPAQSLQDFTLMRQLMLYAQIPGYIEDNNLRLRSGRISDGPFVSSGLRNGAVLKANGLSISISEPWLSIWWWIKKVFICSYCIVMA